MIASFGSFLKNPFQPFYMWVLVAINLPGSLYGFYWYAGQLAETPWYYWPFTPDSPLSTTLLTLSLLLFLANKQPGFLALLACAGVIKYGLWAAIINLQYWQLSGGITPVSFMLAVSHLGMAIEGYIFIRHLKISWGYLLLLGIWLALNDWLDYGIGIYPYLYSSEQWTLALVSAVVLSLLIGLYLIVHLCQVRE